MNGQNVKKLWFSTHISLFNRSKNKHLCDNRGSIKRLEH